MSMRQTIVLSCVAVAASQFNWGQYVPTSHVSAERDNWHQYVPPSRRHFVPNASSEQYDWRQRVPIGNASTEQEHFDWHHYESMQNTSGEVDWHQYARMQNTSGEVDWHQYARMQNTSGVQEPTWQQLQPGNFSGDASDATTVDELNIWRERAQMRINSFTPKDYQNGSLAQVDSDYQQNLHRITHPAAATEAPAAVTEVPAVVTEVPAVVTEAPAVATEAPAVATEAPAVVTEAPAGTTATATTTWWLFAVSAAEVAPAASPLRQASPTLLMFALLAGAAVFAVAVGRRHRHNGASSEPLLPAEYTVVP